MGKPRVIQDRLLRDAAWRDAIEDLIRNGHFDRAWQDRARAQAWTPPPMPEDLLTSEEVETLREMRSLFRGGSTVRP